MFAVDGTLGVGLDLVLRLCRIGRRETCPGGDKIKKSGGCLGRGVGTFRNGTGQLPRWSQKRRRKSWVKSCRRLVEVKGSQERSCELGWEAGKGGGVWGEVLEGRGKSAGGFIRFQGSFGT